ncbi:MAG: hypothetical protein RLY47_439 [Candidatus Parcubacteria bacterium]
MNSLRRIITIALVSFVLHFIWETAHVGLYAGYEHITRLPITLYATLGDVGYVLLGVMLLSLFKHSLAWLDAPARNDYIFLTAVGFLIAVFVEYKGLMLGKWTYLPAMPIVPLLRIGLSPLLQMTLLLPASVWLSAQLRSYIASK